MPSKSKAQRNLMAAAAHNPAFAKKVGVPVSVAQEFNKADKGKKFGSGGMAKKLFGGKESYSEELKEAKALKSGKISEKGFVAGEKSEGHKDEEKNPAKLARDIKTGKKTPAQYAREEAKETAMKKGGKVKKMAMGGPSGMLPQSNSAGAMRGLDRAAAMSGRDFSGIGRPAGMKKGGKAKCMASGGKASQLSKANGVAIRGKSKGKII